MVIKSCLRHVLLTVSAVISLSLSSIHGYVIWINSVVVLFTVHGPAPPLVRTPSTVLRKYDNGLAVPKGRRGSVLQWIPSFKGTITSQLCMTLHRDWPSPQGFSAVWVILKSGKEEETRKLPLASDTKISLATRVTTLRLKQAICFYSDINDCSDDTRSYT